MSVQLHNDVLLQIAKKLMFAKDAPGAQKLVDLRTVNYMFASRAAFNSICYHLRRIAELSKNGPELTLRSPKKQLLGTTKLRDKFFTGPFNIPEWLLFLLLARDVLRIEFLEFVHRPPLRRRRYYTQYLNESPAESLWKLLLFKMCAKTCQKRADRWDMNDSKLNLDAVGISGTDYILDDLDRVLNINSVEQMILIKNARFSDLYIPRLSRVTATRTRGFDLFFVVSNLFIPTPNGNANAFPHKQLRAVIKYILKSCPRLKSLFIGFRFRSIFEDDEFQSYAQWILALNQKLISETLTNIDTSDCELIVDLRVYFPEQTLNAAVENRHEVLELGSQSDDKWPDEWTGTVISRQVNLSEKIAVGYRYVGIPDEGGDITGIVYNIAYNTDADSEDESEEGDP